MTDPRLQEIEQAKLNGETAPIHWHELQRFFAQGVILQVAPHLDLVDVASAMGLDDIARVKVWFGAGELAHVSDQQATQWFDDNTELWTVVVKPYILVQDKPLPARTTH